jgi:hypothetical protein
MGALKIVMDDNELKEPKFNYKSELLKLVSDIDIVNDYIAVGKTAKRTPTKTGLSLFINECDKYKISYESAMIIIIDKGWRGFNYLWLKDEDFEKYGLKKKHPEKKLQQKSITMEETKKILSDIEKTEIAKKQINDAFISYMDDLVIPSFPASKFDLLVDDGKISVASNMSGYYAKKRQVAIQFLKDKFNPEKAITRDERNKFRTLYALIETGEAVDIDVKVKEIVLLEYFDKQIKDGKNKIF